MSILERDLEEVLYSHPRFVSFVDGRAVTGWLARQYRVPSGRIDLLGYADHDYGLSLVVVELKKDAIRPDALTQVCRYASDIEHVLAEITGSVGPLTVHDAKVYKVVIGHSIDRSTLLAAQGMDVLACAYRTPFNPLCIQPCWLDDLSIYRAYEQLAADSPFEMWVERAKKEAAWLRSIGQEWEE